MADGGDLYGLRDPVCTCRVSDPTVGDSETGVGGTTCSVGIAAGPEANVDVCRERQREKLDEIN